MRIAGGRPGGTNGVIRLPRRRKVAETELRNRGSVDNRHHKALILNNPP